LTITAIVDADHVPDPDDVIRRLWNELDLIMAAPLIAGRPAEFRNHFMRRERFRFDRLSA
jgi:cellulose synthase/poly-beta-1,6-N-acetylglucosamine synthase-like glycosyltransferase